MTPPRTRSDAAPPAAPDAEDRSTWPTVWLFDTDEMTGVEKDVAMRTLGIKIGDLEDHFNSYMSVCAVVLARRNNRSIPIDHWKTLKGRDVKTIEPADLDKTETDPTQPL